jgi:hypothetical protein
LGRLLIIAPIQIEIALKVRLPTHDYRIYFGNGLLPHFVVTDPRLGGGVRIKINYVICLQQATAQFNNDLIFNFDKRLGIACQNSVAETQLTLPSHLILLLSPLGELIYLFADGLNVCLYIRGDLVGFVLDAADHH